MGGCAQPREAPTSAWSQRDSALQAAARPGKSARRSCRRPLCRSWTGRRGGKAGPAGCAALAPAAAAGVPSKLGGERPAARGWREEGQRARAAETRSRGSPSQPGRGAAPTSRAEAAAGTCAVAADYPGSGAAGTAGARAEGRRKGVSRGRAAPPPGTRRLYSPGQGWGEAVLSSGA